MQTQTIHRPPISGSPPGFEERGNRGMIHGLGRLLYTWRWFYLHAKGAGDAERCEPTDSELTPVIG